MELKIKLFRVQSLLKNRKKNLIMKTQRKMKLLDKLENFKSES